MRILTASILVLALSAPAFAQGVDSPKSGAAACHAAEGKPAKACAHTRPRRKKAASSEDGLKAQSFTRCRDVRTHSPTKCGGPYAEPLPTD